MSEKYIDLAERITDEIGGYQTEHSVTLNWLDRLAAEHPDQVPGRKITDSEFKHAARKNQIGDSFGCYEGFLDDIGITVVPDPEPTNAEKWETFIRGTQFNVRGWTGFDATKQFAEILDKAGVKAPGGDDD